MADNNKIDVNFAAETKKASSDVRKFKGEIESLGPAGKKAAASISGSLKVVESAIGKVRKAMSMVSFATLWIDAITNIVAKVKAWRESMRQAAVEAQKLKEAAKMEAPKRQRTPRSQRAGRWKTRSLMIAWRRRLPV